MGSRFGDRRDAAGRAHDERLGKAGVRAARREAVEVPRERRPEVRVDRSRRSTLVLAELRCDLVRRDDPRPGQPAPQFGGDLALVARVAEREEQADGDRLGVDLGQGVKVEAAEHAIRPDALGNSDAALERDERLGVLLAEPVEVSARLAPQVQDVLEPFGRDEGGARALPLEQGVRGHCRPVREPIELGHAESAGRGEHGLFLAGGGRDLGRRRSARPRRARRP